MNPEPGDIGWARTNGVMGKCIRLGEWLRFRKGSAWNHMFIVDRIESDAVFLIQATLKGVTDTGTLEDLKDRGLAVVIEPPPEADPLKILRFARAQVGQEYGVLTIAAIMFDIVTWDWVPSLRGARRPSWICSALACEALRFGGWYHPVNDIYTITPAEAWLALVKERL